MKRSRNRRAASVTPSSPNRSNRHRHPARMAADCRVSSATIPSDISSDAMNDSPRTSRFRAPFITALIAAAAAVAATAMLVSIFQRQQEAQTPFYRVVELSDDVTDPAVWGKNFPLQYDGYRRT